MATYRTFPVGSAAICLVIPGSPALSNQRKLPAGSRATAHRHSKDVHVKVLSGSMFIIIGEPLERSRAKRFVAGNVFVVPADAWHDEWWDEETLLEAEGVGPVETVYKGQ